MKTLREPSTMNSSEIAEIIGIVKAQMTHSIDRLVGLELVERQTDKQDRRKISAR